MTLSVPRDRAGTFDPELIAKYQRRFPDFDNKIISMYARGMTVREYPWPPRGTLRHRRFTRPGSAVTDAVLDEVTDGITGSSISATRWCFSMPLGSRSATKASCAIRRSTSRWVFYRTAPRRFFLHLDQQTEGAKFWLRVVNELKGRGVQDILIAVVDGLKGFPEAINAVFPQTIVQTCIVHLIRHSMDFASWKDRRRSLAQALRTVYRAADAAAGQVALDAFAQGAWGVKYPAIAQSWRRNWELVIPFFAFP